MAGMYGGYGNYTNLVAALRGIWTRELVMESAVASLYNMADSNDATERTRGLGNRGLPKVYNGAIEYNKPEEGDLKTFTHVRYADGLALPADLIEDSKYALVETMVQQFVDGFNTLIATHQASVFNNAFATTGDGAGAADGQALCSATSRNTGKADTRNKGTSPLTHDAVVSTRNLMRKWKDSNGNVLLRNPMTIVVPVELESVAWEVTKSVQRSDNANNADNYNKTIDYIVEPLLTDADNWFMVDPVQAKRHLWWWWRIRPDFKPHPANEYDLEFRSRGTMRYSFGADDHTWIYGHQVG